MIPVVPWFPSALEIEQFAWSRDRRWDGGGVEIMETAQIAHFHNFHGFHSPWKASNLLDLGMGGEGEWKLLKPWKVCTSCNVRFRSFHGFHPLWSSSNSFDLQMDWGG